MIFYHQRICMDIWDQIHGQVGIGAIVEGFNLI